MPDAPPPPADAEPPEPALNETAGLGANPSAPTWRRRLASAWFRADPRALGLFRVAFGLLCIWDVLRRWSWIDVFYSNDGILTNHYDLYRPYTEHTISLLSALSHPGEVKLFFAGLLVVLVLFTIGWRTRLMHVLGMVGIISIHGRNVLLENGGDVVMNLWWLWTLFLPLGRRFSVDSLLASLKARKEGPGGLNAQPPPDRSSVWSLAILAVLGQLTVIYLFNTLHKSGSTWLDGSAVAWTLEQDRMVTGLGLWVRETWPLWPTQLMTWGTLAIEGVAPLLLLSPFRTLWTRRIAFLSLSALHGGIFLLTDVGLFSPTMVVAYLILLAPQDIDLLERALRRLAGPAVYVAYDSDCGICHFCARLGARLDRLGLITWVGRDPDGPLPPGYDRARFDAERDETLMAWSPGGDRVWLRHQAVGRTLSALPAGRLVSWIFAVPGLSQLFEAGYRRFAVNRHRVGAWFGFGVCGFAIQAGLDEDELPNPARAAWGRARWIVAQVLVAYFIVVCTTQVLVENRFIRNVLKFQHEQPSWARMTVQYGRIFQGWSMFAPNAPRRDGHLVIDAVLADGTRVDPQTGKAPAFALAHADDILAGQFWGSYAMRIASGVGRAYRGGLTEWLRNSDIQRLHLAPGQQVVRFTAWWIGDTSPDPRVGGEPVAEPRQRVVEWVRREKAAPR